MRMPTIGRLARVRLVFREDDRGLVALERLRREFPAVDVELADACGVCDGIVDSRDWLSSTDVRAFDAAVLASPSDTISVRGPRGGVEAAAAEVLTRYQRLLGRRNRASRAPVFDAVLRAHGALDPRERALGLDAWQWALRLAPDASLAAQIAALFHRADEDTCARALRAAGVDEVVARRVAGILDGGGDGDAVTARDATALAFLSLESAECFDAHGAAAARRAIARTSAALGRAARAKLVFLRLLPAVQHFVFESLDAVAA